MDKKQHKKYIIMAIVFAIIILFIGSCLTTNVPDELTIIPAEKQITAYQNLPGWTYHFLKRDIIPGQALQIYFWYSVYGNYYNTNHVEVMGGLYITEPYKKLYIKEISYAYNGKNKILIRDKYFDVPDISDKDILVGEDDEPIIINGKHYYWASVDLNKKINHHFINGFLGQEKEMEVTQIYSFDDEPLREEKYKYKVICGGTKFDPMRLIIWMYPP